jgi:hypothetical protein
MLIKLIFAFFLIQNCRENYLDNVLDIKNFSHYYVVVNVSSRGRVSEIVLLNLDLNSLLAAQDSSYNNKDYYKNFVKDKIYKNEGIEIDDADLEKYNVAIIHKDKYVQSIADKGKKYFLNRFFNVSGKYNYAELKNNVDQGMVPSIVEKLFKWNYFVGIVESKVSILNMNFCDKYSESDDRH